jgi:hypothetical protein
MIAIEGGYGGSMIVGGSIIKHVRSKSKNAIELISYSSVYNILDYIVLLEISRA